MTIWLYSGTPGSGKSYHVVVDIVKKLKKKKFNKVICNFNLYFNKKQKRLEDNFIYKDNSEMTIEYFKEYASKNHAIGVENQTLIVIDEAQILFNSRDWNSHSNQRMEWIKFFSQHRKFGYNFVLISQFDRMLDRQIRSLIEYEVAHLKLNNFWKFIPITFFMCVERWYGQKMKIDSIILPYKKYYSKFYNTFDLFDNVKSDENLKDNVILIDTKKNSC